MTKEELLKNCTWDRYGIASLDVEIPILKTNAKIDFIPGLNSEKKITEDMTKALNDVLNLNASQIGEIKNLSFRYFNLCCEATRYGFDIDIAEGETVTDANKRYFDVKNEDDAWEKSKLEFITIAEDEGRTVTLQFEVPWDDEHGCVITIINGEQIEFGE